jgi:ubiquinone/menaquinone biosynthesis C-methylase UbiE
MPHKINLFRKIEVLLRRDSKKESQILEKVCVGKGIDVGCGSKKVSRNCIGVDLFGKGEIGKYGCESRKFSEADIKASGDDLPFENGELYFVVAKHNLEHYKNPEKTLREWKRVLKKGGKVGIVVPDERFVSTRKLDPTHYYEFDLDSLESLFRKVGFRVLDKGTAAKHWSIYLIAEKVN